MRIFLVFFIYFVVFLLQTLIKPKRLLNSNNYQLAALAYRQDKQLNCVLRPGFQLEFFRSQFPALLLLHQELFAIREKSPGKRKSLPRVEQRKTGAADGC